MTVYPAINPDELPTVKEIKNKYKYCRGLKLELHENGRVETISHVAPCLLCGKQHQEGSKAQKICNLKIVCGVAQVLNDEL